MYGDWEYRMDMITGMNAIMIAMNNEQAYMEWIETVPDCTYIDDIEYICNDEQLYFEAVHEFMRIFRKYSSDGLYITTTINGQYMAKVITGRSEDNEQGN